MADVRIDGVACAGALVGDARTTRTWQVSYIKFARAIMVTALAFRGVAKRFGSVEVISDFSLEIASGEFAVFLGPSGCGKSTLLRMVAGLEALSAGEIHLGGSGSTRLRPASAAWRWCFSITRSIRT